MDFLSLGQLGATTHFDAWTSHCSDFSCCRAQALDAWSSVVEHVGCCLWALELRLSGCVTET